MTQSQVIAVIPARGGSKGIPRKNVRLLAGKPLIYYAIETARSISEIDMVLVSTDSEEIRDFAELAGAEVLMRPAHLAEDHITLDPVIHHAVCAIEERIGSTFDLVLTLQPTSPLLTVKTLSAAINRFLTDDDQIESMLSVTDDRHLCWTHDGTRYLPAYQARVNRQQLPPNYRETGAFFISRRACVTPQSRLGERVSVFEVPAREAIDIDHPTDWWVAEKLLGQKRIILRADGHNQIGLGHIMRVLLLAHRLIDHQLLFITDGRHERGAQLLEESHFPVRRCINDAELCAVIDDFKPHIIVNDILDTDQTWIQATQDREIFTVNFEDLGAGAKVADLVINALYESPLPRANTFWSHQYFCLRDEFLLLHPRPVSPHVDRVLLSFGGADPNNYTLRILQLLNRSTRSLSVTVIMGRAYEHRDELEAFVNAGTSRHQVEVLSDVKMISKHMHRADVVFTSAGRTVYEVASLGTPMIVLAQNQRELSHSFVRLENGVVNLGLGTLCDDEQVWETFESLADGQLRAQLQTRMLAHDLKGGVTRVIQLIFEQYRLWQTQRSL